MNTVATKPRLTVWYNTKCPVCSAGITWQRNRLVRAARAGLIDFRDINLEPDALSRFDADVNDVRRRLHAVDAAGKLYVGADCAIAIWLATPGQAWLGHFFGLPIVRQMTRFGYDRSPICCSPGIVGWVIGRGRSALDMVGLVCAPCSSAVGLRPVEQPFREGFSP